MSIGLCRAAISIARQSVDTEQWNAQCQSLTTIHATLCFTVLMGVEASYPVIEIT